MGAEILVQTTKATLAVVTLHVLLMRFSVNDNDTLVADARFVSVMQWILVGSELSLVHLNGSLQATVLLAVLFVTSDLRAIPAFFCCCRQDSLCKGARKQEGKQQSPSRPEASLQ